jgi:hypothetical protein
MKLTFSLSTTVFVRITTCVLCNFFQLNNIVNQNWLPQLFFSNSYLWPAHKDDLKLAWVARVKQTLNKHRQVSH